MGSLGGYRHHKRGCLGKTTASTTVPKAFAVARAVTVFIDGGFILIILWAYLSGGPS
jgi:hypothetical protein